MQRCAGPAVSPTRTAAPRALRAAYSLGRRPGQPKHHSDIKVLPTDSTSGCPPRRRPPPGARSAPSAAKVHMQSTLSVLSRPAQTPLPAKAPTGPHSGCGLASGYKPPPLPGTYTKPRPWRSYPQPLSPRCRRCLSPVPKKGCISVPRPAHGPRLRVLGSRGPREATEIRTG